MQTLAQCWFGAEIFIKHKKMQGLQGLEAGKGQIRYGVQLSKTHVRGTGENQSPYKKSMRRSTGGKKRL